MLVVVQIFYFIFKPLKFSAGFDLKPQSEMKPKKLKLQLNKETIANLNELEMSMINGANQNQGEVNYDADGNAIAFLSSIKKCTGFMCCEPGYTNTCVTEQDPDRTLVCNVTKLNCQ
jgi:hypothetical protein